VSTEFRILGPLEALTDGTPAKLGGSRPRAVLAVLLLHSGQPVSMARLVDGV
jgi:DNA-binding SARP family transcriptional activator